MTSPIYIHGSSLSYAGDCLRRWAARNLAREITAGGFVLRQDTPGVGAAVGTGLHRAAEITLTEKRDSGRLPPISVATDAARDTVKEAIANGVQFDQRLTKNPEAAYFQVIRMAKAYHLIVAPRIEPIHIEERFEAEIPWTHQPIIATCQPDVVAVERHQLRDTKGESKRGNHNAQAGIYSLVLRHNKINIHFAMIDWVARAPVRREQPMPEERHLDIDVAETSAIEALQQIDGALTTYREGDARLRLEPGDPAAFPANPQSILCHQRYCPAHSASRGENAWCRAWMKDKE